jgi:hypothetical protein
LEEETKDSDYPEMSEFLASVALEKYEDRFIQNGFEDLEAILELNDTHLDCLFIPLGHKLKILKRIKVIREEKGMAARESRQGSRPDS